MPLAQLVWSLGICPAARMDHNGDGLLIRQLVFQKNYNTYVVGNKGISYSRCREIFLEALKALGYNSKLFGLHSLRSGGATAAVTSPSGPVSDRLLKLHGDGNPITPKTCIFKKIYLHGFQFHLA